MPNNNDKKDAVSQLLSTYRVAIIYDKVNTPYGGAEWVLQALHSLFPEAPLFTSLHSQKNAPWAKSFTIIPSFLNILPFLQNKHQLLAPTMPLAFESLDVQKYDVLISVTSGEAKGILTKPDQLHICYLLTPPRYLYDFSKEYLATKPLLQLPILNLLVIHLLHYVRWWDSAAMWRPDKIITISKLVTKRLKQYYGRTADSVIYPPLPKMVASPTLLLANSFPFHLVLSRLVPYKKIDLAIAAMLSLNETLIIAGDGEAKKSLVKQAGTRACVRTKNQSLHTFLETIQTDTSKNIYFVGRVTNSERQWLLSHATTLLMPGKEDFGITALEAVAAGAIPIIHKDSGVAEILEHGVTALHTDSQTIMNLVTAITESKSITIDTKSKNEIITAFSMSAFKAQMQNLIYDSIIQMKLTQKSK